MTMWPRLRSAIRAARGRGRNRDIPVVTDHQETPSSPLDGVSRVRGTSASILKRRVTLLVLRAPEPLHGPWLADLEAAGLGEFYGGPEEPSTGPIYQIRESEIVHCDGQGEETSPFYIYIASGDI